MLSPLDVFPVLLSNAITQQNITYQQIRPFLGAMAFSSDYNDLSNKPTIPAAQLNSDWNASSGLSRVLNKPSLATVATTGAYNDLTGKPTIPSAQVNSDWSAASGVAQILNKPTIPADQIQSDWNQVTTSALDYIKNKPTIPSVPVSSVFSRTGAVVQASGDYNSSQITENTNLYFTDERAQDAVASMLVAGTGLAGTYNDPSNTYTYSAPRTTSALSLSLVGTGATGTQISATKDSTVRLTVSTSTTSTIGGPSTSIVSLKICSTNNVTEGSWTTIGTIESDQTITLALVLQSIQIVKGQLCADVPAGWYVKLVNSGTGTHTETFLSGQQTIYG